MFKGKKWDGDNPAWESKEGETTLEWTIRQVDRLTTNWSDETWKIMGITRDLIDIKELGINPDSVDLKKIRGSASLANQDSK